MTETTSQSAAPREALDAAIEAARIADPKIDTQGGRQHVFIPDGFSLKDVTDPHALTPYIKQAITFDDRASLTAYANRFSHHASILIADHDAGRITAHLDWHHDNSHKLIAAPCAHHATLTLRASEEFARWNEMEGDLHSQEEFATFIEENVADVIDPDHSVLLEICRDLEATTGVAFKSGIRLDNGDRSFVYETETRTKGDIAVPTEIKLSIPLYHGEEPVEIRAKFRFRPSQSGLGLGFRWHRVEYQRQAVFRAMAHAAADETGLPVFYGRAR